MKNLEVFGVQELNAEEMRNQNGGVWIEAGVFALIGLLVTEWESTKQAAKDAWNGVYNPPK